MMLRAGRPRTVLSGSRARAGRPRSGRSLGGRLGRLGGDDGLSLPELLVTMVLFSLIGTVIVQTYAATTASVQRSTWRQDNTRLAQNAMETLTKSIRAGSKIEQYSATALPAFTEATETSLGVHAFLGDRPTRLTYTVDSSGQLVETRLTADAGSTAPYWTFSGTPTTRVVTDQVVNTASQPLFVYYDGTGTAFVPTPGDTASLDAVRSVEVSLSVQARDTGEVPPTVLEQRIYLPNLGAIG